MAPGCLKKKHILLLGSSRTFGPNDYTRSALDGWVKKQGGVLESILSPSTTHLVCDQDVWAEQGDTVQKAQALDSDRRIHCVRLEWLFDTLTNSKREKESDHLWIVQSKGPRIKRVKPQANSDDEIDNLADVLQVGTRDFVDQRDQKRLDQEHVEEDAARRTREREERARVALDQHKLRIEQGKARFKQLQTQKPGCQAFAKDYHIYRAKDGFVYNVLLTKTDVSTNSNERCNLTLQIFESNVTPFNYVVNMHHAGTNTSAKASVLTIPGTNIKTALYVFGQAFTEKTNVLWKNRLEAFSKDSVHLTAMQRLPFATRPLTYHLPTLQPAIEETIDISDDDASTVLKMPTREDKAACEMVIEESKSRPGTLISSTDLEPEKHGRGDSISPDHALGEVALTPEIASPVPQIITTIDGVDENSGSACEGSQDQILLSAAHMTCNEGSCPRESSLGIYRDTRAVPSVEAANGHLAAQEPSKFDTEQPLKTDMPSSETAPSFPTSTLGRKRLFEEVDAEVDAEISQVME